MTENSKDADAAAPIVDSDDTPRPLGKAALSNRAWFLRAGAVLLVAAIGVGAGALLLLRQNGAQLGVEQRAICADFADSVGVYKGNSVSLMGVSIGSVREIVPRAGGVRITLDVDKNVQLPADVGAVVIDNSIVTDRRVEFTSPYTAGPTLSSGACIPIDRTRTPRGISESFTAASKLLGDALGTDGKADPGKPRTEELATLVNVADESLSKRGEQIKDLLRSYVRISGDAPETDAIMRRLLENGDVLTARANEKWPDVELALEHINGAAATFSTFSEEFAGSLKLAVHFAPILGRVLGNYGDRILAILKYLGPWVNALVPHLTSIAQIVAALPGLATVTDQIFDRKTGALRLMWRPPSVDMRGADVAGVCAAVGKPAGCIVDSSSVGLVQLLMGSAR